MCRKFSGNKRKSRFVPKQAIRGPVTLVSFVCWVLVAGLAVFGVLKFASPPTPTYGQPPPEATAQAAPAGTEAQAPAATAEAQAQTASAPGAGQNAPAQPTAVASNAADPGKPSIERSLSPIPDQVAAEAWLVIVESIPKSKRVEAEQSLARHKKRGLSLEIVDTDAYPRLKGGMWTLASGPYDSEKEAQAAAAIIKPKVRDLMIRRGL